MSLISTYDLRLWMGIEEGDKKPNVKLAAIANAVEEFADSYTNRKLEAARYSTDPYFSYLDGNSRNYIYLPQYPVSYVSEVNVDADRVFGSGTVISQSDYIFYPSGKLCVGDSMGIFGKFSRGRRNIKVDFIAGYAPIVGGTWNSSVSTYPIPLDLKQVMTEMCVESFKEGMTAVHSVQGPNVVEPKFIQMLRGNSLWSIVLNKYKAFDKMFSGRDE